MGADAATALSLMDKMSGGGHPMLKDAGGGDLGGRRAPDALPASGTDSGSGNGTDPSAKPKPKPKAKGTKQKPAAPCLILFLLGIMVIPFGVFC